MFERLVLGVFVVMSGLAHSCAADAVPATHDKHIVIPAAASQTVEIAVSVDEPPQPSETLRITVRAWLDFDVFGGYRRAFKAYWDGVELTATENMPEVFTLRDGRKHQSYVATDGWTVPYALSIEQVEGETEGAYYPEGREFTPGVFEFVLPGVSAGAHVLMIERTADVEQDLVIGGISTKWKP